MAGFTAGGGKPAKASKKDGVFPTAKSGKQNRGGGAAPRASRGSDGLPMNEEHMGEAMSTGDGPAKGPSFSKKFGTSAMAQAVRKRASGAGYP